MKLGYITPYTIIGGTIGFALNSVTQNREFPIYGIALGIGFGHLRNINIENSTTIGCKETNIVNSVLKTVLIYKLVPIIFVTGLGFVALLATIK